MTPKTRLGVLAIVAATATISLLPAASQGGGLDLGALDTSLRQTTQQLDATVERSLDRTEAALRRTEEALRRKAAAAERTGRDAKTRATATDPPRQPPLHGTDPHGQGGVAIVDLNPSSERPLGGNPDGSDAGPEETVVGRARGEKSAAGFNGHITILALLGSEIAGVDTAQGETKNGPLQPIQSGVLDPLCTSSGGLTCLSVLTANSTSNATSSTNDFAIARATVAGIGVGAAESSGTITEDANCQTSTGTAKTVNVTGAGGGAVAQAANSSSSSKSCRGQAPQTANSSMVIGLGGVQVPLPAAGCADGTPDTVSGIPPLLPIVCNADEIAGAAAVREALDVYVLTVANNSLAKETTAAAESLSVAPAGPERAGPQCSDGADNDGDGKVDAADPGCHTDGNPNNPASFNPNDNDESDPSDPTDGSGDPDDGPANEGGPSGSGDPECSDDRDNDGDGVTDADDPGCHSDGDPNNPASYNPNDDSEADGPRTVTADSLPFTGTDVTGLALAGLLLLGGGLLLRRREGVRTGR